MSTIRPKVPPLVPEGATFAFGESPFHAKGVLYIGTQSFFEANLQGGMAAFAAEIAEPELRAFIEQKFLASSFYDVMPVPALIAYEARALRMPLDEYLVHRTRWQAKKDLGGVYGWVVRLASPGAVARRLPKVFSQMFDFCDVPPGAVEERSVTAQLDGVPAVLEPWLVAVIGVYADTAMKLSGARHVDSTIRGERTGERAGVPLVRLRIDVAWE